MQKSSLLVAILGSLVLALGVMQVMLFQRLTAVQKEISALKSDKPDTAAASDNRTPDGTQPTSETAYQPRKDHQPDTLPAPRKGVQPKVEPKLDPATPVNAGQVEAIVNRLLKERDRKSPFANLLDFKMEDPIEVMKRELKLSPSQIVRIKEHRKNRQASFDELHGSDLQKSDWKAWQEQWKAVQENYEALVKSEMDYNQQQKYGELKKSGKLMDFGGNGTSMHYVVTGDVKEKKDD